MNRVSYREAWANGNGPIVEGVESETPGLAVKGSPYCSTKRWGIDHMATGLSLAHGYPTRKAALMVAGNYRKWGVNYTVRDAGELRKAAQATEGDGRYMRAYERRFTNGWAFDSTQDVADALAEFWRAFYAEQPELAFS